VQAHFGSDALQLVGRPMRTESEIIETGADVRDEVARVGRLLAEKLGFDYPAAAEATIRRTWQDFLSEHLMTRDE
jgi:hypothetical protein